MLALRADDFVIEDAPFEAVIKGKGGMREGFISFLKAAEDFPSIPGPGLLGRDHLL
ncbi:MAG: hypothetical protein M3247_03035 [Thermoproteota archaeon]|nr:hypothetical protein [Thermoproteota archaeon]